MRAHLLERSQRVLHIIAIRPASQPQGPGGWREHERGARGRPPRARRADCEDRERGEVSAHDIRRPRGRGELRQRCTRASYALRSSPRGPGPPPPRRAPAPCSWGRDCDWVVITELVRGNDEKWFRFASVCLNPTVLRQKLGGTKLYESGKTAFYSLLPYRATVLGGRRLSYFESLICTFCICMPPTLSSSKSTSESVSRSREIYSWQAEALRRQWQARVRAARNAAHPSKRLLPDAVRALPAATAAQPCNPQ